MQRLEIIASPWRHPVAAATSASGKCDHSLMSIVVVAAVVPVLMAIATVAVAARGSATAIGAVVTVAIHEKTRRLAASTHNHHPVGIACTKEIAAYAHRRIGIGWANGAGARVHRKSSFVLVQTCLEFAEAGSKTFVKLPLELLLQAHNEKRQPYYILYTHIQIRTTYKKCQSKKNFYCAVSNENRWLNRQTGATS